MCSREAPKGGRGYASTSVLHTCTHCRHEFKRPGGLDKHLRLCGPLARPPDAFSCLWGNRSFKQPSGLGKHKQSCPKRPCSEPSDTTCSDNDSVSTHVDSIVCPKGTRWLRRIGKTSSLLQWATKTSRSKPPHTPAPIAPALLAAKDLHVSHQRHCFATSPTAEADESQQGITC